MKNEEVKGNEIFKTVTDATGLPQDLVARELNKVLTGKGLDGSDVTLDELRDVLADYLREVILHAKDKFDGGVWIEETVAPEDLGRE